MADRFRLGNPVVLVHGLGARHAYGPVEYFYGLPKLLRGAGNRVFIPKLTPWHSIEWRARQLKEQLEAEFDAHFQAGGRVNLIGHSMGGLDSRYLVSALGFGKRVASVTTIGTPNRGTWLADLASGLVGETVHLASHRLLEAVGLSSEGFRQIGTRRHAETLAGRIPDAPGVAYFSATSAIPANFMKHSLPAFWLTTRLLKRQEGDNDGFVSVQSASWGQHVCTYRGDHYGQIGQLLGRSRGLDYLGFYGEILGRLNREAM